MTALNLKELLRSGRKRSINKGQVVQSTEDWDTVNFVESGYLERYLISSKGSLGVSIIYGPGDIFPITLINEHLFNQEIFKAKETYYYEAMTDSVLYSMQTDRLIAAVKSNPVLYRDILRECNKRLGSSLNAIENITLKSSLSRVAHKLAYYGHKFGHTTSNGTVIDLPLTQQDLADILSVTRETVSLSMVELKKMKLIVPGKKILIPDVGKLEDLAYS